MVNKGEAFSKTKYQLSNALMHLLEKKSFRRISVGDICREAMVSRSGFYVHFADKYELLEYCFGEIIKKQEAAAAGQTLEQKLLLTLNGIQDKARILHNVFIAELDHEVIGLFERLFQRTIMAWLENMKYIGLPNEDLLRLTAAFYAGGLANVVICWVREGFQISAQELAHSQSRLLMRLLGDAGMEMPQSIKNGDAEEGHHR